METMVAMLLFKILALKSPRLEMDTTTPRRKLTRTSAEAQKQNHCRAPVRRWELQLRMRLGAISYLRGPADGILGRRRRGP